MISSERMRNTRLTHECRAIFGLDNNNIVTKQPHFRGFSLSFSKGFIFHLGCSVHRRLFFPSSYFFYAEPLAREVLVY